mmetsp:Transcript_58315/g.138992  ORF Transcript_58315/g.138992 Transcript_58315/m.138992 type:complete len:219 (+) Transcript_58315:173-829(+)
MLRPTMCSSAWNTPRLRRLMKMRIWMLRRKTRGSQSRRSMPALMEGPCRVLPAPKWRCGSSSVATLRRVGPCVNSTATLAKTRLQLRSLIRKSEQHRRSWSLRRPSRVHSVLLSMCQSLGSGGQWTQMIRGIGECRQAGESQQRKSWQRCRPAKWRNPTSRRAGTTLQRSSACRISFDIAVATPCRRGPWATCRRGRCLLRSLALPRSAWTSSMKQPA